MTDHMDPMAVRTRFHRARKVREGRAWCLDCFWEATERQTDYTVQADAHVRSERHRVDVEYLYVATLDMDPYLKDNGTRWDHREAVAS
jgi:hypothetical protein